MSFASDEKMKNKNKTNDKIKMKKDDEENVSMQYSIVQYSTLFKNN